MAWEGFLPAIRGARQEKFKRMPTWIFLTVASCVAASAETDTPEA